MSRNIGVIVAAGKGLRSGFSEPKQFVRDDARAQTVECAVGAAFCFCSVVSLILLSIVLISKFF